LTYLLYYDIIDYDNSVVGEIWGVSIAWQKTRNRNRNQSRIVRKPARTGATQFLFRWPRWLVFLRMIGGRTTPSCETSGCSQTSVRDNARLPYYTT